MKNRLTIFTSGITLLFLLTLVLFSGCSKDNDTIDPEPKNYDAYVSHNFVLSYTSETASLLFKILETSYPEVSGLLDNVQYNVNVYNVTYNTMFQGEEIEASGLVCIPVSDGGNFPMLSFQNGTNTAHDEAPTKNLHSELFKFLHITASVGYIIIIPDYIGFGKSEQFVHPYLHKESTVLSVENLIVAVTEMMTDDLIDVDWDEDLYLMGYSQGGWSTMCTHRDISEKTNLPFNVTASACGAGPYSLSTVQDFMFEDITYPQPVYMAYSGISYHELGLISNPLSDYFNEPFATQLPTYFNGEYSNGEINEMLNDTVSVLVANSFLTGINSNPLYQDFRDAMNDNSVEGWNSMEPIRVYHGTSDTYVPIETSEQIYNEFVTVGTDNMVTLIPLPGLNHTTAIIPMALDALLWFTDMEQKSSNIVISE